MDLLKKVPKEDLKLLKSLVTSVEVLTLMILLI